MVVYVPGNLGIQAVCKLPKAIEDCLRQSEHPYIALDNL